MPMSVNIFRLRCTIDAQARSKIGHPAHSTTGLASANSSHGQWTPANINPSSTADGRHAQPEPAQHVRIFGIHFVGRIPSETAPAPAPCRIWDTSPARFAGPPDAWGRYIRRPLLPPAWAQAQPPGASTFPSPPGISPRSPSSRNSTSRLDTLPTQQRVADRRSCRKLDRALPLICFEG